MASIVTPIVMFLVGRYNLDGRLVNRGRASSVGRALDCRVGGRGLKGAMSHNTHARANENKLEKDGPTFSSCVGDFGRLFLSV